MTSLLRFTKGHGTGNDFVIDPALDDNAGLYGVFAYNYLGYDDLEVVLTQNTFTGLEIAALFPCPPFHFLKRTGRSGEPDLRGTAVCRRVLHLTPGIQPFMGIAIPPDPFTGALRASLKAGQFLRCCHHYLAFLVITELMGSVITLGAPGKTVNTLNSEICYPFDQGVDQPLRGIQGKVVTRLGVGFHGQVPGLGQGL